MVQLVPTLQDFVSGQIRVILAGVQLFHFELYLVLQPGVEVIDLLPSLSLLLFIIQDLLGPNYFDVPFELVFEL